uniref:ephrin-B2a-like n=1 Tax=Oncorhynchus gorbuscha TaxID=8017 RepID=UPI001EAF31A2
MCSRIHDDHCPQKEELEHLFLTSRMCSRIHDDHCRSQYCSRSASQQWTGDSQLSSSPRSVCWFWLGVLVVNLSPSCSAVVLDSVYWNSSNPKFSPGQGLVLFPQIGDKMDIVCPRVRPGVVENKEPEYYRVYLVTREQLHSCSISQSDTPLLNCDKPDRDVKFTFKFQEFSPNLWGLEFFKGRQYYIT